MHIKARNVNPAFAFALQGIAERHEIRNSRAGPIIACPGPVMIEYDRPCERVLFSPKRNANPVFHLLESLWMLAGRNDLKFPATIVKRMTEFSDDGKTLWGAYGFRWREFFGYDQIEWIIDELKANPESRRCVMSMWNGMDTFDDKNSNGVRCDLYIAGHGGADVPCNTHIYFDCRGGKLNMTVCNRSNDLIWGCFGANVVHMSVLLEYMALSIGIPVGVYRQFTNDLHLYSNRYDTKSLESFASDAAIHDQYAKGMSTVPLWNDAETKQDFDTDLTNFFVAFDQGGIDIVIIEGNIYRTEFFNHVVLPMVRAWRARKNFEGAPRLADKIVAPDWAWTTKDWLLRNNP